MRRLPQEIFLPTVILYVARPSFLLADSGYLLLLFRRNGTLAITILVEAGAREKVDEALLDVFGHCIRNVVKEVHETDGVLHLNILTVVFALSGLDVRVMGVDGGQRVVLDATMLACQPVQTGLMAWALVDEALYVVERLLAKSFFDGHSSKGFNNKCMPQSYAKVESKTKKLIKMYPEIVVKIWLLNIFFLSLPPKKLIKSKLYSRIL